jgi:hypothetical protein
LLARFDSSGMLLGKEQFEHRGAALRGGLTQDRKSLHRQVRKIIYLRLRISNGRGTIKSRPEAKRIKPRHRLVESHEKAFIKPTVSGALLRPETVRPCIADNCLLLQIDCVLRNLIEGGDGFRICLETALGDDQVGELGGDVDI